jgi:hypothetical protein
VFGLLSIAVSAKAVLPMVLPAIDVQRAALDYDIVVTGRRLGPADECEGGEGHHKNRR